MDRRRRVVFIHGAGGGGWEWHRWAPRFHALGWATLTPSLVPAGAGLAATRFEDYLDQVAGLVASNGQHLPTVLVGASMGGLLALKAAECVPVAALVLINSIPPAGTPGWPPRMRRFPEVVPWSRSALEDTRAALPDADEEAVRLAYSRWRDESGAVMRALYGGIPATAPAGPTLVIAGQADKEVPVSVSTALAQHAGADLAVFPEVSHVGPLLGRHAGVIAGFVCAWLEDTLHASRPSSAAQAGLHAPPSNGSMGDGSMDDAPIDRAAITARAGPSFDTGRAFRPGWAQLPDEADEGERARDAGS